jgi:uncharacterized protein YecE (DUF72 family)
MTGNAYIGISGWRYPAWRRVFYPVGLPQRLELHYAARQFSSVELNGSFYSLQTPASYERWRLETPDDFVFSVKGGRFITHMLSLRNTRTALANFFASGLLALGPKLGPILWQLPERLKFDAEVLDTFLAILPRSTAEAAVLAAEHDVRLDGRAFTAVDESRPLRHALEVRSETFVAPEAVDLLAKHGVALVVADTAGRWPLVRELTADFVYVRLHGAEELYSSGYTDDVLASWAADIRTWLDSGRDVYLYFDNDMKVHAPFDALRLAELLGVRERSASPGASGSPG